MAIIESTTRTCSATTGFWPGSFKEEPILCEATVGLASYVDVYGKARRYCRHHKAVVQRRFPKAEEPACRFCHRTGPITDGTYTRMSFGGRIDLVCDDCFEKGNEAENEPEWSGAFR